MERSCVKLTFLSSFGVGFVTGSVDFIRRGNVGLATRTSLLAIVGTGAFVNLLCQTRNVSNDIKDKESFWDYKVDLDERLKRKYEQ